MHNPSERVLLVRRPARRGNCVIAVVYKRLTEPIRLRIFVAIEMPQLLLRPLTRTACIPTQNEPEVKKSVQPDGQTLMELM